MSTDTRTLRAAAAPDDELLDRIAASYVGTWGGYKAERASRATVELRRRGWTQARIDFEVTR